MKRAFAASAAILLASLALPQAPAFADGPGSFSIGSLSYAGSGCPAGTVASNIAPDAAAFTLLFDSYLAEVGPGVPLSASRKNCQLTLTFVCPAGWQFALVDLDTRGYVALDAGVRGTQKTTFYFQGSPNQGSVERNFVGPSSEDYSVRDTVPASNRQWGLCGSRSRALNVNTQVRLDNNANRGGAGLMTADSIDGSLTQVYGLVWQRSAN